jgi:pyruvate dehydrogenase E1 component alpha subunit
MRSAIAAKTEHRQDFSPWMGLVAGIDRQLTRLSHAGLIPNHQPCIGEEAVLVGCAAALEPIDWAFWGRQVNAAALFRGLPTEQLFAHALRGDYAAEIAKLRVVSSTAGSATRIPHAVGLAHAARTDGIVALCELGDGVISDGDFHTGLTFAGVLSAPVVFVVRSNGQRPLLERGPGYGVHTANVQGDDLNAVYDTIRAAVDNARNGNGPTLVEAIVDRNQSIVPPSQWTAHEDEIASALAAAEQGSRSNS